MARPGRVLVAMSGGVDSSVAAALLHQQGYEVLGIGLRFPQLGGSAAAKRSCCGWEGLEDARRVAARLGFPFYLLDYEQVFERAVVEYFCRAYLEGRTPNPCVECNRAVKFGELLRLAEALGAERLATGHYARIERNPASGRWLLLRAADRQRDQSYFLYALSQRQLERALFPLGAMSKEETRRLARSLGLEVSEKPASQDVCFLGSRDYRRLLAERFPEALRAGAIVDERGRTLGEHRGIAFYTIGQRRGLRIAAGEPRYVVALDRARNAVVIGKREALLRRRISLAQVNWIALEAPCGPLQLDVKIRHRQAELPAAVVPGADGAAEVLFSSPPAAVAPGQSAVFYAGDVVVGGGIIQ